MYRWIRTAKISNGRFPQAIGWAKEVSGFVQKKFKTPDIRVYTAAVGEIGTLVWETDYSDLATLEKIQAQIPGDSEYWQYIHRAAQEQLFIDGETRDTLLRQL
jgi:hypothetical protein